MTNTLHLRLSCENCEGNSTAPCGILDAFPSREHVHGNEYYELNLGENYSSRAFIDELIRRKLFVSGGELEQFFQAEGNFSTAQCQQQQQHNGGFEAILHLMIYVLSLFFLLIAFKRKYKGHLEQISTTVCMCSWGVKKVCKYGEKVAHKENL